MGVMLNPGTLVERCQDAIALVAGEINMLDGFRAVLAVSSLVRVAAIGLSFVVVVLGSRSVRADRPTMILYPGPLFAARSTRSFAALLADRFFTCRMVAALGAINIRLPLHSVLARSMLCMEVCLSPAAETARLRMSLRVRPGFAAVHCGSAVVMPAVLPGLGLCDRADSEEHQSGC
jgi:hypothetical protein